MTDLHTTHPGVLLKQRFLDPLGIAPHELARAGGPYAHLFGAAGARA